MDTLQQTRSMLEEDKLFLETKIALQNETLIALGKDIEDLAKQEEDILGKIKDLEKDQAAAQKEYYENKKLEDQLDKELEEYLAELQRKNQEKMESGDWLWPISLNDYQRCSSGFGWRKLYGVWDYHRGWDLAAYRGTPIYASKGGKVVIAQYHNSYGNYIVIDHGDGVSTVYAHCSKLNVAKGDTVKKGDKIGEVGTTGNSTGNHLHYEFRLNGKYIDPFTYIKNPPIQVIASRYEK
jgi:murein DD-endopeptidase MepM/ murein hydrolase activator NlpD